MMWAIRVSHLDGRSVDLAILGDTQLLFEDHLDAKREATEIEQELSIVLDEPVLCTVEPQAGLFG